MLIPEVILYNTIKAFLSLLETDYNTASDVTQTILSDLFSVDNDGNALQLENLVYFQQAATIFARTAENPRQCQVYIGYSEQRAFLPSIHILLPQESPGRYDSIGLSAGEVEPLYSTQTDPSFEITTRVKTYQATFDLLATSDNITDVLLIYYMLKSLFPYLSDTFEILGLHNFKLTGMDVQYYSQTAPSNIFQRILRVQFDYQSQTKLRKLRSFANSLSFAVCSKIGDDNRPAPSGPQQYVSNNYVITISKNIQTGTVGYIRFVNKLTNQQVSLVSLVLTGQGNNFQLEADLAPAPYTVEVNLLALTGDVNGSVGDGVNINNTFQTSGQFNIDRVFDMGKCQSSNIEIDLNFS